jgi:outer membrane murein-binding lipoprotein Lpp
MRKLTMLIFAAALMLPGTAVAGQKDQQEGLRWCLEAKRLQAKVDHAKERADTARAEQSRKLKASEQDLERAKKELHDYEQLAHQRGIPPGWLRCQF